MCDDFWDLELDQKETLIVMREEFFLFTDCTNMLCKKETLLRRGEKNVFFFYTDGTVYVETPQA